LQRRDNRALLKSFPMWTAFSRHYSDFVAQNLDVGFQQKA